MVFGLARSMMGISFTLLFSSSFIPSAIAIAIADDFISSLL